ncbi:hypothetical protein [Arenimonas oryziterrae]|uniref:SbsA Ig-like domain-containing protein n=1 Tax=Arenimonas oryziterrae DSM 21050 = YC6267 TaxID=1121015 RepID=A0A091AVR8_9GAMM|nr:hypothetical protein [Arenimonas oryziterrae]KFN43511.1 hypothetical protein N789_09560 [Arenimonas oryziterrae DSM 21050 = YC6267]
MHLLSSSTSSPAAKVIADVQVHCLRPSHCQTACAPGRTVLEIHFNRPMAPTIHIFGDMPEVLGPPTWNDARDVLVIPVMLAPRARYRLRLNAGTDAGFRGEDGQLLAPCEWSFSVR